MPEQKYDPPKQIVDLPRGKKPRAKRRNFERELTDLQRYCEISIEVLQSIANPSNEYMDGQIAALRAVLQRLEAK